MVSKSRLCEPGPSPGGKRPDPRLPPPFFCANFAQFRRFPHFAPLAKKTGGCRNRAKSAQFRAKKRRKAKGRKKKPRVRTGCPAASISREKAMRLRRLSRARRGDSISKPILGSDPRAPAADPSHTRWGLAQNAGPLGDDLIPRPPFPAPTQRLRRAASALHQELGGGRGPRGRNPKPPALLRGTISPGETSSKTG